MSETPAVTADLSVPPSREYVPVWLSPADVKRWLKLHEEDTSDDDLLVRVSAQTEPHVQRCRPEFWTDHEAVEVTLDGYNLTADVTGAPPNTGYRLSAGNGQNGTATTDVNGAAHISYTYPQPGSFTVTVERMDTGAVVATGDVTVPGTQSWSAGTVTRSYDPDAEAYQGAIMYAAREFSRRSSPQGVQMFGDAPSFVARYDPDIDKALRTGSYMSPVLG